MSKKLPKRVQTAEQIQNPHDALFKAMCEDISVAIDLLKAALPQEIFGLYVVLSG